MLNFEIVFRPKHFEGTELYRSNLDTLVLPMKLNQLLRVLLVLDDSLLRFSKLQQSFLLAKRDIFYSGQVLPSNGL